MVEPAQTHLLTLQSQAAQGQVEARQSLLALMAEVEEAEVFMEPLAVEEERDLMPQTIPVQEETEHLESLS
jgi:hypothetical protein